MWCWKVGHNDKLPMLRFQGFSWFLWSVNKLIRYHMRHLDIGCRQNLYAYLTPSTTEGYMVYAVTGYRI